MKWAKYRKENNYSYTLGIYPTIELLKRHPDWVVEVILSSNAAGEGVEKIKQLAGDTPILVGDKQLKLFANRGDIHAAAVFNKRLVNLESASNHLLLYSPDDAGNLGTILRAMLAFSFKNLALIGSGLEVWNPKVIRGSMGACFGVNVASFDSLAEYQDRFAHQVYAFAVSGQVELSEFAPKPPFALLFGNEGAGLPPEVLGNLPQVRIDQTPELDSINLALSVGISLYHIKKFSQ